MFFTQEDYKKIQQWLIKNSVKDTEFNKANIPLNGNEIVSIVQGNQNKRVFLKDLVSQIFNLGVSDFINITDKYDAPNISLEKAIRLIPSRARKEGQVITFLDMEDHWHIYQFKGALNQWNVLDTWEDLFDWEKLIINSILPDEEDLTKSLPDINGNSYLSFKDRTYNPEDFSGLGRVILRKNIVEIEDPIYGKIKKNVLYQDMFTQSNTVYEIRYDFDLNNQTIIIPENCVLDFQGGSLNNGVIVGSNTLIKALNEHNIFGNLITLNGSWNNIDIAFNWFGAKPDGITDNSTAFINLAKFINNKKSYCNVFFSNGIYAYKSDYEGWRGRIEIVDCNNISYIGNETIIKQIKEVSWDQTMQQSESPIQFRSNKEGSSYNITIKGLSIIGDNIEYVSGKSDGNAFGIAFRGVYNIIIDSCVINGWSTDGIYIGTTYSNTFKSNTAIISKCLLDSNVRQGISIAGCDNVVIENCQIKNTIGGSFGHAIDLEPNADKRQNNIKVINCTTSENKRGFINIISTSDVIIANNIANEHRCNGVLMTDGNASNVQFINNIVDCNYAAYYLNGSNITNIIIKNNIITARQRAGNSATFRLNPNGAFSNIDNIIIEGNTLFGTCGIYAKTDGRLDIKYNTFNASAMSTDGVNVFNIMLQSAYSDFSFNRVTIDETITHESSKEILIYKGCFNNNELYSHENAVYVIYDDRYYSFCKVDIGRNKFSKFFYYKGEDNRFDMKYEGSVTELINIQGISHRIVNGEYTRTVQGKNARVNDIVFYHAGDNKDGFYIKKCIEAGSPGTWLEMKRLGPLANNNAGPFIGKPTNDLYLGRPYFCQDKQTSEGGVPGIMIYYKGNNVWVDALGRVVQ